MADRDEEDRNSVAKLLAIVVLVTAFVTAGCAGTTMGSGSGDGDQDYSDRCLRLVIERASEIEADYRTGRLDPTSPEARFLDKYGPNNAMIPAQVDVARTEAGCEWVDDDQDG